MNTVNLTPAEIFARNARAEQIMKDARASNKAKSRARQVLKNK